LQYDASTTFSTSTKQQAEILKLNNVNGCNDISFGDHSILEGDRIPRETTRPKPLPYETEAETKTNYCETETETETKKVVSRWSRDFNIPAIKYNLLMYAYYMR